MLAVIVALIATSCAQRTAGDPLQVADTLQAATAAVSPTAGRQPAGRVLALDAPARSVALEPATGTVAVAVSGPERLLLFELANPDAAPRTVSLPAAVTQLDAGRPGELLATATEAAALLRISLRAGQPQVRTVRLDGRPTAAVVVGERTVVALQDRVVVLEGDQVAHTVPGFVGAGDLAAAGDRVAVLDRLRTAVYQLDPVTGRLGPGLRAGNGASSAVADRFGRVLITDTRDGELLAFTVNPMIMRQRFPVPGAPYAIAYDAQRDLAWVTLTESNEVVGFDVAGGEPVQRYRMATVRQPNAVAVDGASGTVVVASGTGEGIQVVKP